MENCYYAEGPNWVNPQYQTATAVSNESSTFRGPWPHVTNSTQFQFCGGFPPSWSSTSEGLAEEDRAASASKSHSQAEKRRRDRINAQLATLRKLIPQSDKMDKAALLRSVIDEVKDLKRKATEVSKACMVPTESDEITVCQCDFAHEGSPMNSTSINKIKDNSIMIRVSVCCDDQPELFRELIQVLKRLKLTVTKADIASAGGRIKSILVLCSKDSEETVSISNLKQALKLVLSKIAASSGTPNCRIRSKRQRFFLPFPKVDVSQDS
ncbi:transcription factor bHLH51 [Argentina anserina]|uniref:transcription factor bHLH51 n=1 Tax=Argentina anserina TaxID=57926 RepID=UPI00217657B9|nr:transcription factor bHLH51 [Potentilla anserina]XP_050386339.1 transcription factor bHLH51 [Potentilla anserina]